MEQRLAGQQRSGWRKLSGIGRTYGAASAVAVVAAIASAGVVGSLVVQLREARTNRKNTQRAQHTELLGLAMQNPLYMECWGPYLTDSFEAESQYAYVNLIVTQWHTQYTLGEISDVLLKATASSVFSSRPGRTYWDTARTFWRDNYPDRRSRRFYRILEEIYTATLTEPVRFSSNRARAKPNRCLPPGSPR